MPMILSIDDSATQQQMLASQLQDTCFSLLQASDLETARGQLQHRPALIMTELLMLDCNGFEIATQLRAQISCPLVLLSSRQLDTDESWSRARGFHHIIHRPIARHALIQQLQTILAGDDC